MKTPPPARRRSHLRVASSSGPRPSPGPRPASAASTGAYGPPAVPCRAKTRPPRPRGSTVPCAGPSSPWSRTIAQARRRFLAGHLPANAGRRRLPERRRLRRLLPHASPFHHRSAWLGDRDVFGELVAGCRRLGMVVVAARTLTLPTTTFRRRTRTGSPWTRTAGRVATGPRRRCGSPAVWALQLRVHDRGDAGDHGPLPGGRRLRQPLGGLGHVPLRALSSRLPRGYRS